MNMAIAQEEAERIFAIKCDEKKKVNVVMTVEMQLLEQLV